MLERRAILRRARGARGPMDPHARRVPAWTHPTRSRPLPHPTEQPQRRAHDVRPCPPAPEGGIELTITGRSWPAYRVRGARSPRIVRIERRGFDRLAPSTLRVERSTFIVDRRG